MTGTPSNLCFCPRFLAVVFWSPILALGCNAAVVGRLRGSVELSCKLQPLPQPIKHIMVYWQLKHHEKDLVVAAALYGKVDVSLQNENYRGRAHLNPLWMRDGNFTLHLSNLTFRDNGTYVCIILWEPSSIILLHESKIDLKVTTAEFSPPVVENRISGEVVYGEERTLTCTTQGRYWQPRIMWINSNDGTELQKGRIHNHTQEDGDIINVTSTISINVTSSINISCIVITEDGNITSQAYKMDVTDVNLQDENQHGVLTLPIVVTFTVIMLLGAGIVLCKRKIFSSKHANQRVQYQGGHISCEEPETNG
ncbi:ICOS ligand-like [Mixophyes fleayi]|uniref:ICOS ligand-like n=1 Tax=Mixophyes fleayi TaxID=3061075 RepID=UPI003F4DDBAB